MTDIRRYEFVVLWSQRETVSREVVCEAASGNYCQHKSNIKNVTDFMEE